MPDPELFSVYFQCYPVIYCLMLKQIVICRATADNHNQLVLDNSSKDSVLVHFGAPWVGPCMMLKPLQEKLLNDEAGRFLLVEVNTDKHKETSRAHSIDSLHYQARLRKSTYITSSLA